MGFVRRGVLDVQARGRLADADHRGTERLLNDAPHTGKEGASADEDRARRVDLEPAAQDIVRDRVHAVHVCPNIPGLIPIDFLDDGSNAVLGETAAGANAPVVQEALQLPLPSAHVVHNITVRTPDLHLRLADLLSEALEMVDPRRDDDVPVVCVLPELHGLARGATSAINVGSPPCGQFPGPQSVPLPPNDLLGQERDLLESAQVDAAVTHHAAFGQNLSVVFGLSTRMA